MEPAELIVRVLDLAGKRLSLEDEAPELMERAGQIQKRYGELKRTHDFTTSGYMARHEFVSEIVASLETERDAWIAEYHETIRINLLLRAAHVALRKTLEDAPHEFACETNAISLTRGYGPCTCWKSRIPAQSLAQVSPDGETPQAKT